jgi:hypothetical protein
VGGPYYHGREASGDVFILRTLWDPNVQVTMTALMNERRDALNDRLMEYMELIDKNGLFESHQLIDETLLQLETADLLARSSAVAP